MAAQLSVRNTQPAQTIPKPKVESNNFQDDGKKSTQHSGIPHNVTDSYFSIAATRHTKDALHNPNSDISHTDHPLELRPSSAETCSNYLHASYSRSPLVLSPTETASAASSPGTTNNIWDSPKTPSRQPVRELKSEVLTPLTPFIPLSTQDVSKEQTVVPKLPESPLTKVVKSTRSFDKETNSIAYSDGAKDEPSEATQDEGCHPQKKLFRNLIKEFQAIKKYDAADYKREPSFDFLYNLTKDQGNAVKDNNTKHRAEVESTKIKAATKVTSKTQKIPKEIQKVLEHILPVKLRARLRDGPHLCVASEVGKSHKRCSYKLKRSSSQAGIFLEAISRCYRQKNYTDLLKQIKRLVEAVTCGKHRNAALLNSQSNPRWAILEEITSDISQRSNDMRLEFDAWVRAITTCDLPIAEQDSTNADPWVNGKLETGRSHTTRTKSTPLRKTKAAAAVVFPSHRSRTANLPLPEALRSAIIKPLTPTDKKCGFIYMFWDKEHFGQVKIGRTNNLERRLAEWNQQCKRIHSYHKASISGDLPAIPHVNRIERLIHIELRELQKRRVCDGCGVTHKEWFDVSEANAVKVFQKWQTWILQKPYAPDHESGEWGIRPEMLDTLLEVCQPVLLKSQNYLPCLPRKYAKSKPGKRPIRRTI